jgi:serine protease Do
LAVVLALVTLLAGCPNDGPRTTDTRPTAETTPEARDRVPTDGFRDVVENALPAIVFIQAEAAPPAELGRLFPQLPDEPMPIGMGSGVIFREDGYILTNNHVVQDAERVLVVLHDRRYFEAEVVGRDPSTEVAVVRIPANGLTVAPLADSDQVGLGDWVLAMGSPLGLQFSVTVGIVSGTGRALGIIGSDRQRENMQAAPLEHFIQTDAGLSPGNSGGPLINSRGEVVGINTAVAAPQGVPASVGFAIPTNLAYGVAVQLTETGEVRRPFLGVALRNVTPRDAESLGLPTVEGAIVAEVQPGSPAADAGLQEGDIIVAIEGEDVQTVSDLQAALAQREPGDSVSVRFIRNGTELEESVRLTTMQGRG